MLLSANDGVVGEEELVSEQIHQVEGMRSQKERAEGSKNYVLTDTEIFREDAKEVDTALSHFRSKEKEATKVERVQRKVLVPTPV